MLRRAQRNMANRIDKVFSVNRIRQSWLREGAEPEKPQADDKGRAERQTVMSDFDHLVSIVQGRFNEGRLEAMNGLLNELREMLQQRFSDENEGRPPTGDETEMNTAANEILNQIEDLAEAFELQKRT